MIDWEWVFNLGPWELVGVILCAEILGAALAVAYVWKRGWLK